MKPLTEVVTLETCRVFRLVCTALWLTTKNQNCGIVFASRDTSSVTLVCTDRKKLS